MPLILLLLSLLSLSAHGADYSVTRQYVRPAIISQVTSQPGYETVTSSGSVVVIAPGYAITAAHVVPETQNNTIFIFDGIRLVKAKPIKIDRVRDLALIAVPIKCPCAPIAYEIPSIDDPVVAVGFPLYTTYRLQLATTGTIQGSHNDNIVTTSTTAPGGSGGGLFAKVGDEYQLIGVAVAIASAPIGPRVMGIQQEYNWLTFSVPVSTIRSFLRNTPAISK